MSFQLALPGEVYVTKIALQKLPVDVLILDMIDEAFSGGGIKRFHSSNAHHNTLEWGAR